MDKKIGKDKVKTKLVKTIFKIAVKGSCGMLAQIAMYENVLSGQKLNNSNNSFSKRFTSKNIKTIIVNNNT